MDFITNKQINISTKELEQLKKQSKNVAGEISKLIDAKIITFPYKRTFIKSDTIIEAFEVLKGHKSVIYHPPSLRIYYFQGIDDLKLYDKYTVLLREITDNTQFEFITDIFQEHVRLKCKRVEQDISSYKYWKTYSKKIVKYCIKKYGLVNMYALRESLFDLHYEVGTFRLSVVVSIIKYFDAKHVLDPFSGWGDRLVGSLACGVKSYQGIDANSDVFPGYKQIEEIFNERTKVNMINQPIEDVDFKQINKCDLILTSPPYFNLEIYTGDESLQSMSRHPKLDDWIDWLVKSLKKCWKKLRIDGHMAIVINDSRDTKYVQKILNKIHIWEDVVYEGCITYAQNIGTNTIKLKSPQPIWIWRKKL